MISSGSLRPDPSLAAEQPFSPRQTTHGMDSTVACRLGAQLIHKYILLHRPSSILPGFWCV